MAEARTIRVLMAEDDPADAELAREALQEAKVMVDLVVVEDGEACMAYLRREGEYAGARRPDLILLDLNMPRKSGREVLQEVKEDPELATIPIVVLTVSREEEDILRAYEAQAACYVVKPVTFATFLEVVRAIDRFWFSVVSYPTGARGRTTGLVGPESPSRPATAPGRGRSG